MAASVQMIARLDELLICS